MERLGRLFRPKSVAVIGGGAWGEAVIAQCQKIGFDGELWVVHPKKDKICGLTPYRTIADLPAPPDAAYVAVNRFATIDAVAELAAIGAGGAVCFASGFKESAAEDAEGMGLQAALLDAAGEMPIIGPNCYGFINYLSGVTLWPDQHGGERVDAGVAIITQSSNVAINLTMQRRGLPIAYVVTVGNQAQTGLSDVGRTLLADPKVTALGLYIEGIDDLAGFAALAADARQMGKPIIALKIGRSEQAQKAAVSHTASLAGSDVGADALLMQLGIGRVKSPSGFLETLKLVHMVGPLGTSAVASMSCSGGEASLMADTAQGTGVTFPPLTEKKLTALRATLGPLVALSNPLDYHTFIWGNESAMTATFAAMMGPDVSLGLVVLDFPRGDRCGFAEWELVLDAIAGAQEQTGQPIAVLASLVENLPEDICLRLIDRGILPMCGMEEAIEAIGVAATVLKGDVDWSPLLPPQIVAGEVLTEAAAKAAIEPFGITVPASQRLAGKAGLHEAAHALGFPLVLKGEGVAHKTESGAVVLGLASANDVFAAATAMASDSFLLEEMVQDGQVELLVGVVLDHAHGYVLTMAAGGTLTEILADHVHLILPVSAEQVLAALKNLRIAPLLDGYRGAPSVNTQAIVKSVLVLQEYVKRATPYEVEINPLICGATRAVAADALITTGVPDD